MMKSTTVALVIALDTFSGPSRNGPSPIRPTWGSECVTDEGQGRFFPCDCLP